MAVKIMYLMDDFEGPHAGTEGQLLQLLQHLDRSRFEPSMTFLRGGVAKKVLDIGCGAGFDNSRKLQTDIAAQCDELIGIEPDLAVDLPATIVMVLEHLADPQGF